MSVTEEKEQSAKVSGKVSVGHPVDVATGTLTHDFADHVLPGRMPLIFARRYSSKMPLHADSVFGAGWSSPFQMYLRQDLDGYNLLAEDGETVIPFDDTAGVVEGGGTVRNLGMFHELRRDDQQFIVTRWNNDTQEVIQYLFPRTPLRPDILGIYNDSYWPLASRRNLAGQGIDIERDRNGRILVLRQRREGRGLRLVYGESTHLTEVYLLGGVKERLLLRYAYDLAGRLCEMTDALGQRCSYVYDDQGRMIREVNLAGMVYHFRHDKQGRCIETTGLDGYGRSTLQIEERARITQVFDALDQVTLYKWNESGQVEQQISPLGQTTTTTYDDEGRIVAKTTPDSATTQFEYDERGDRIRVIAPNGATTSYEYDDSHQVVAVTDPTGLKWQRRYNESGLVGSVENPLGQTLCYDYDHRGDLLQVHDSAQRKRSYRWDQRGLLVSSIDPLGHSTQYEYDEEGSLVAVIDPRGHRTELLRDALGRIREIRLPDGARRRFARDAYDQITQYVDELGAVTQRRYAACGLLVEEVRPHGGRIQLEWGNIPGQLLAVRNELGERHTFEYDADGRMLRQTNFSGHATHYEYEQGDKVSRIRDPLGQITRFERNPLGAVTRVVPSQGLPSSYEYDPRGLLIKANNGVCPVEREYDELGRLLRERQGVHVVESEYDAAGNRFRRRSSLDHDTLFEWDANSQLALLWQDDLAPIRFEYDPAGNEVSRAIRDGVRISHDYDRRSRRSEQKVHLGSRRMGQVSVGEDVLHFRKYNYDAASNLTEIFDNQHGTTRYGYDAAGRITSARLGDGFSERFTYDPADNIRQIESQQTTLPGTQAHRLLAQFDYRPGNVLKSNSGVEYDYNALGQQVAQRENGQETRYFWNEQGMLARVVLPNGEEWTYRYDPLGRRVEKRGPKERIEFIWDGDVVLHEIRTTEGKTEAPIHWEFDPYGFAPIGKIEGGQHYLCVNNINGAPQELRAQDGHTAWSATFTTFGKLHTQSAAEVDCPIRFQGQWLDAETGLHYNRFRYYNPANIKYISGDPIGIFGGTNTYSYPTNSLQWIDPLGLTGSCPVLDMSLVKTSTGETREDHIRTHEHDKPNKSDHGVFMEDGVAATHEAWQKGHEQGIAIQSNGFFEVPMGRDVGLAGGQSGLAANHPLLNGVRIILQPGTNKLITAYPIYIPTS